MRCVVLAVLLLLGAAASVHAAVLRLAYEHDLRSLDPYAGEEVFLESFAANIYEPLVQRGADGALEPALAESWRRLSPSVWRFRLRPNVVFQDGASFTAADVAFSFARARGPDSRIANRLAGIERVTTLDERTVEIATRGPDPLLLDQLADVPIMSKAWCEVHDGAYIAAHADGTGLYAVEERVPDERTVLAANPRWWGERAGNIDQVIFTPVPPDTLMDRIKEGTLDLVYDVPPPVLDDLAEAGFRIIERPGLTTIFLGFDEWTPVLPESSVKGANPFQDRRVREAAALAIDERAIIAKVMRGHASPAGLIVGPGIAGYDKGADARPPYDPTRARKLLAEAGYAKGFATGMDCPDDRYLNDAAICDAVVAMLAQIGIAVDLHTEDRASFFEKLMPQAPPQALVSMFLMGWTPTRHDAFPALRALLETRDRNSDAGAFNAAGYSNPAFDALLAKAAVDMNAASRAALLKNALQLVKQDYAYIPLHRQNVIWAARPGVDVVQPPGDALPLRLIRVH